MPASFPQISWGAMMPLLLITATGLLVLVLDPLTAPEREDLVPLIPILSEILERKPLLVHGVMSLDTAKELMRVLPSRGLALLFRCDTAAEAARVLNALT